MSVTSPTAVQNRTTAEIKCSLGTASAMFNMSNTEFVAKFVRRNRIQCDRLHQFKMKDVLRLYRIHFGAPRFTDTAR